MCFDGKLLSAIHFNALNVANAMPRCNAYIFFLMYSGLAVAKKAGKVIISLLLYKSMVSLSLYEGRVRFLEEEALATPETGVGEDTIFTSLRRPAAKVITLMTILFIPWC